MGVGWAMERVSFASSNVLRGAGWMLLAALAGSTLDACVKALADEYSTSQIVLLRLLLALPLVLAFAHLGGGFRRLRPRYWGWHIVRSFCAAGSIFGFFYALGVLPLMTAVAIGFASPLLVGLLSRPFLGETVGLHRWAGMLMGFAGVLVVLNPGMGAWHPGMLAALASAFCWAVLSLSTRKVGNDEPVAAMVLFTVPLSLIVAGVLTFGTWTTPTPEDWALFALAGVCGGGVHFCIVYAYRAARAASIAPVEYTALIWAALFGWIFWREVPSLAVLLGSIVIVAGGIVVLRARD
jgi:drug/metabolite transporter (DMT)-like permease